MLRRIWSWFRGPRRPTAAPEAPTVLPTQAPVAPSTTPPAEPPPVSVSEPPSQPVKTMPPGTVTLIHDDGTVSSLPDPAEPSITYVVDELLAAQALSAESAGEARRGDRVHPSDKGDGSPPE